MHSVYRPWLLSVIRGDEPYAISPQVLSSVMRIATNPRAFAMPANIDSVVAFAESITRPSHCRTVHPGSRHWSIFRDLCRQANATGNLVQDAWFAAMAIENGCEWITEDRDYSRFPGLRHRAISAKPRPLSR